MENVKKASPGDKELSRIQNDFPMSQVHSLEVPEPSKKKKYFMRDLMTLARFIFLGLL